jgi:hypothetical protein
MKECRHKFWSGGVESSAIIPPEDTPHKNPECGICGKIWKEIS